MGAADKSIVVFHLLLAIQYTLCSRINVPLDQTNCGQHVNSEPCIIAVAPRLLDTVANRQNAVADAVQLLPASATDTLRGTSVSSSIDHKLPPVSTKMSAVNRSRRGIDEPSPASGLTASERFDNKPSSNFLRLYFCGPNYQNCMYDERLNDAHVRQNVLDRIPQMAEITVPTNYIDWKSRQLNLPSNTKEQNQWPANSPREPHYVLVRSDEAVPQRLALLSGSDLTNDPFVPMRGRRFDSKALKDAFTAMRGRKLNDWDDPFVPMRGRKFDQNAWDDPFIPMRGRRRNDKNTEPVREQRSKAIPADLYLNDPFIPMRGRRQVSNDNDTFVPQRGRRSVLAFAQQQQQQQQQQRSKVKRGLFDAANGVDAVYTPSEEVIVKLNGSPDQTQQHHHDGGNHHHHQLIEGTNFLPSSMSSMHAKRSMHKFRQFKSTGDDDGGNDSAINSDITADNNSNYNNNDYGTDYNLVTLAMNRLQQRLNRYTASPNAKWMDSSADLSSKRDNANGFAARGSSATSFAI